MQKQFLVFIFSALCFSAVFGQKEEVTKVALQALLDFKKGAYLVVKLPTSAKKLAAIAKDEQEYSKNVSYLKRLNKIKQAEIGNNLKFQKDLMSGLEQFYKYSPFVAVFDTTYDNLLKNNEIENIFYDENLEQKKDFSLKGKNFYTFRMDQVFYDDGKAHIAFVITEKSGAQLKRPFPFEIPYKFRREPILPTSTPDFIYLTTFLSGVFGYVVYDMVEDGIKDTQKNRGKHHYYERISYKKLNRNVFFATAEMLQLKLEYFEDFVQNEYQIKQNQ